MIALVNKELYSLLGPMTVSRIWAFKSFVAQFGLKRFSMFADQYHVWCSELPRTAHDARNWLASHVSSPYMPYPDKKRGGAEYVDWEQSEFRLLLDGEISQLDARSIAWAAKKGGIVIGYPDTPYGSEILANIKNISQVGSSPQQCLHLTKEKDVNDLRFLLWKYVVNFSYEKRDQPGLQLPDPSDFHKHFNTQKFIPHRDWTNDSWVKGTQGKDSPALFLPGFKYKSPQFYNLLVLVLKTAYQANRYDYSDMNGFVVDVGAPIGAAAGEVTSRVELYITKQNVIHLRPCEKIAMASAEFPFKFD